MILIKRMGLTAMALLAASAIVATGAQASLFHVEAAGGAKLTGAYPSGGKGSEKEAITFSVNGGTVPCFKASFSGSMAKTAESLTLSATTIGECFAWSMSMGSCDFVFSASGTFSIGGGAGCSAKPIEFEPQIGCIIQIGAQNLSGVSYVNKGSGSTRDITATINVTEMHYQQMSPFCDGGQGTFKNGTLTGILTVRADQLEGGAQQGLWIE